MSGEYEMTIKPIFYTNLLNDLDQIKEQNIYRYIKYDHLYTWYRKKELYLPKPSEWDDPFENIILNAQIRLQNGRIVRPFERNFIYGQCWTLENRETDAFWRIYSQYKNKVRIRTTIKQLWDMIYLNFESTPHLSIPYGLFMGIVKYLDRQEIEAYIKDIKIRERYTSSVNRGLPNSLLFKRTEFDHEKEVRLIVYDFHKQYPKLNKHLALLNIDPEPLIDEILFDPRINEEQFEKRKKKLSRYATNIKKSELYSIPNICTEI